MTTIQSNKNEFDNTLKNISFGIYEGNENYLKNIKSIIKIDNTKTGFYGEVFIQNNKVIIAFRGTDPDKINDLYSDGQMLINKLPDQYTDALNLTTKALEYCTKNGYTKEDIIFTGHSLGGSLAQILAYQTGCEGVTFNAFGTNKILHNKQYKLKGSSTSGTKIRNYGNSKDPIFRANLYSQVGKTYIIDNPNDKTDIKNPLKYHFIENMGDIKKASRHYTENMDSNRVIVIEESLNRKYRQPNDEYAKYFLQQVRTGNYMWQKDISKKVASGEVYVHSYTREDGTKVREYYRSRPH